MKLAVSNIAWRRDEEDAVADLLARLGVKYIEVAPTKEWPDPTVVTKEEALAYRDWWADRGIEIVAFQSMLFNRPDLKIFNEKSGSEALQYLSKFINLAGIMGAKVMVFGSPKNRQTEGRSVAEISERARGFFGELGEVASQNGVCFCIEPNAPQYACDFITNTNEGIEFVSGLNSDGIGLHLDAACMALAGDDIGSSIKQAAPLLRHFHISSPMLDQVEERADVDHVSAAEALRTIGYQGYVSIEMKPSEGSNLKAVEKAVRFAKSIYG